MWLAHLYGAGRLGAGLAGRLKVWLDAWIVVVGARTAIWYFVFVPVIRVSSDDLLSAAVALAYPIGDLLLLLLGIATVLLRRPDAGAAAPLRAMAAGLILMVISDMAFGPAALQGEYEGGS